MGCGRRHGEIAPIAGALEIAGVVTGERPRDDASDDQVVDEPARDPAELEQAVESESRLVGGDLEHGITRGVDDRLTAPHVLQAKFGDDGGAGGMLVAEDPGKPAAWRSASR